jgi:Gluconate 2-dehydrogenase subunit 3
MSDIVRPSLPLPLDPATGEPLKQTEHPGYYPGYSTLAQQDYWDAATRRVVLARVHNVPPIRFFSEEEARLLKSICDRVLPQDDRLPEWRIPIVPHIDKRLYEGRIDGYRYENMPPDREAHKLGLQAIDQIAREFYGNGFIRLPYREQEEILKSLHDGKPRGAQEVWQKMPVHRYWMLLVQDCAEVYYAHPYAWDEIGFGGPAYPRAYMRLEGGRPEPWEVHEQRYEWDAPSGSLSDRYEFIAGEGEHMGTPGQGGTH